MATNDTTPSAANTTPASCPLCRAAHTSTPDRPIIAQTPNIAAFHDIYPSALGHILIVPLRHVGKLAHLIPAESTDLWNTAMELLTTWQEQEPALDFTVGINDGPLAGQTIPHVHLHIIPRRTNDTHDPRGGIRWVIPSTAPYWNTPQP